MIEQDLLGRPLDGVERDLVDVYARLKALCARPDLPPCVAANARAALAVVWQAVNDLDLEHEALDHLGV